MADYEYLSQSAPIEGAPGQLSQLLPPKDLSHHYSRVTKVRVESVVKNFYKYFAIPDIGNLAGGMPNAGNFPYDTLEARAALPQRFQPSPNGKVSIECITKDLSSLETSSSHIEVPHDSSNADPVRKIDLAGALQYGQASGFVPLASYIRQFTRENLHPNVPYLDGPETILSCGATDGFAKALECFSNVWSEERDWVREREGILCEEFAYMNAINTARPRGLQIVTVKMDDEGILPYGPGGLEDILANWDHRKGKRPHLMYLVTLGQNPTSSTQSVERRKEIYALASTYDIIIIEDEPYWYLQYPSSAAHPPSGTQSKPKRESYSLPVGSKSSGYEFLDSLLPSYLSIDTDGRVVRLDTFSKTVAPGCRLGWITAQPAIIERLMRITETSTQQPSGFVQAMIAQLIIGPQSKSKSDGRGGAKNGEGWKTDGWVRWLAGLRGVYERRMNCMASILEAGKYTFKQSTPIKKEDEDWAVVSKSQMFDFDWPRAGMFLWMKILFESHPLWGKKGAEPPVLAKALWKFIVNEPYKVLMAPGSMFCPSPEIAEEKGWAYVRLCFAAVSEEEVVSSSKRLVAGFRRFWMIKRVEELEALLGKEGVVEEEGMVNLGLGGMGQFC